MGDQSERKADMIWRKEKKRDQSNKKSGEEAGEVMESFITRWYPDILRYCVWHAPNMSAAEDAAQETFLKLIRYYKEEVEKGKNLRSLLYRIASGVCIDMWRKKSVSEVSLDALAEYTSSEGSSRASGYNVPGEIGQEAGDYEQVMSDMEMRRLVNSLPEEQREIVILRFSQDLTLREIAGIVKLPLRTVQSRLRSALNYLKRGLEQEQEMENKL